MSTSICGFLLKTSNNAVKQNPKCMYLHFKCSSFANWSILPLTKETRGAVKADDSKPKACCFWLVQRFALLSTQAHNLHEEYW